MSAILFMLDGAFFIIPSLRYRFSVATSVCVGLVSLGATVLLMLFIPPGLLAMQLLPLPGVIGACFLSRDTIRATLYTFFERQNIAFITHCVRSYLLVWVGSAGLIPAQIVTFSLAWLFWRNRERHGDSISWMNKNRVPFFIFPLYIVIVTRFLLAIALDGENLWAFGVALSMTVVMLLANVTVDVAVRQSTKATAAELRAAELQTVKKQMELYNEQIARYAQAQGNLDRLRHDVRHHNNAISGFLAGGDYERARRYIGEVERELDANRLTIYCENYTVNVLLLIYAEKSEAAGALLRIDASLPAQLRIDSLDIVALFSNALDNALCAASDATNPHERRISLTTAYDIARRALMLRVENTFSGAILWDGDGMPISEKADGGIGTKSIAHVVEKYDGLLDFAALDGVFTLTAMLFEV